MTPAARIATAADLLDLILAGDPAEKVLTSWARRSRFAGSKDRAAIRDLVFDALRCRRSHAYLGGAQTGRAMMLGRLIEGGEDATDLFTGQGHAPAALSAAERAQITASPDLSNAPEAVAADMPDWLWPRIETSLGAQAQAVCATLRKRAPVFLRVNLAKTTRDKAIKALEAQGVITAPHDSVPTALVVTQGARRIAQGATYQDGLVELQDAASQDVTAQLDLKPGMTVLDYCAGGGGKSLAMAARSQVADGIRFAAHDANPARLSDLPDRARRAGAQIAIQTRPKGVFDLVLCDVPCSGSGSWRRAPEGKWTLTDQKLTDLTQTQDAILDQCAALVAPGGTLAYATCSLLQDENDMRRDAFLSRWPEWQLQDENRWWPGDEGDGFYLAQFRRS